MKTTVSPIPGSRPPSAVHAFTALTGLTVFLATTMVLWATMPFGIGDDGIVLSALLLTAATSAAVLAVDIGWQKVHRRSSAGLDFEWSEPSWRRTAVKFAGLVASLAFVAALYWLFPEYHSDFYARYYRMLSFVVPLLLLLAVPYIHFIDRYMINPQDGYWNLGKVVTFDWTSVDAGTVGQHLLGWLIKGFFLPLMFTYLCEHLERLLALEPSQVTSFKAFYDLAYDGLYFVDLGIVTMGYLMTLRIADAHIRSAEPTVLGWVVALACYMPFFDLIGGRYLAYDSGPSWGPGSGTGQPPMPSGAVPS